MDYLKELLSRDDNSNQAFWGVELTSRLSVKFTQGKNQSISVIVISGLGELMPFDTPEDGKCYLGVPNIVSVLQRETRLHEISLTDTECHLNNLSRLLDAI